MVSQSESYLAFGFMLVLGLVTYHNALSCDFVFDDISAIKDNRDVHAVTSLSDLFSNDFWGTPITQEKSHKSYRPLTVLTYRLNYLVDGLNPVGYHLTNVLLHIFVSMLLYILCRSYLLLDWYTSTLCSVLFVIHPVHTEAVTGVVGRAELLSSIFFILTLMMHIRHVKADMCYDKFGFPLMAALILGATLCKEQGITVAAVCVLYDLFIGQQLTFWHLVSMVKTFNFSPLSSKSSVVMRTISLAVITIAILALRLSVMGNTLPAFTVFDNPASSLPTPYRQLTYNYLLVHNVWLLICPANLCCDWTMGTVPVIESFTDPRICLILLFWSSFAYLVYCSLCVRNGFTDCLFMSMILLSVPFLPASNLFFPVGFVVAERVLYLPSLGFCILLAGFSHTLYKQFKEHRLQRLGVVFSLSLLIISGCLRTYTRNKDWKDEYSIFTAGLRFTEDNAKLWNNVGHVLENEKKYKEALSYFTKASQVQPDDIGSHVNVGRVLKMLGRNEEAEVPLQAALKLLPPVIRGQVYTARIAPSHLNVFITLANLISRDSSRLSEAESLYKQAINMRPDFVSAYINYGELLMRMRRFEEALKQYNQALKYDPRNADTYYNIGVVQLETQNIQQALMSFNSALNIDPKHKQSLYNSALMMQESGQTELFIDGYKRLNFLLRLEPNNSKAHFTSALIKTDLKEFDEAKHHFEEALKIEPDFKGALFNMALLLANDMKRPLESLPYIEKCLQLYPDHVKSYLLLGDIAVNHIRNFDLAEKAFGEIIKLEPDHVQARHNLCVVYAEREQLHKAEKCLVQVLQLSPNESYIQEHLNIIRNKLKHIKPEASKTVDPP